MKCKAFFFCMVVAGLLLGSGCATTAPVVSAGKVETLELGRTTKQDCERMFGPASRTARKASGLGVVEVLSYKIQAERHTQMRVRGLDLEFKQGLLSGYVFASSFDEDRTTFPITNISKIVLFQMTKENVLELLGKPTGRVRCPTELAALKSNCGNWVEEIWLYMDLHGIPLITRGKENPGWIGEECRITFAQGGRVLDLTTFKRQ